MPPFELPDFYMPYPARQNPHLDGARRNSKAWAYSMGILGSGEGGGGAVVWSERRFDAMDFAFFTANTHPDVSADELDLLTEWYIWGWYLDDYCPTVFEHGDVAGAREYVSRILEFVPVDLGVPVPEPTNPVELALVDLWPRTAPTMSPEWRRRYGANLRALAEAYLREIQKSGTGKGGILDPVEFVRLRRDVGGIFWSSDLVEHSLNAEIPAEIYDSRPIRVLRDTFADVAGLRNDIISYQIDIDEGKVNNGVVVMQHFLGCDLQRAVDVVNDQVTSRVFQLENTVALELPPLFEERGLDAAARQRVLRYVKAIQDWLAGDLEWELRPGGRYLPASAASSPAPGPTGLGTAAARLGLSRSALGLRQRTYAFIPYEPVGPQETPTLGVTFPTVVSPLLDQARARSKDWARRMGMLSSSQGLPGAMIWDDVMFDTNDVPLLGAMSYPDAPLAELERMNAFLVWGLYLDDYFLMVYAHPRDVAGATAFLGRLRAFMPVDAATPLVAPTNPVERGLAEVWSRLVFGMSTAQKSAVRFGFEQIFDAFLWELQSRVENRHPDLVDFIEMRRQTYGSDLLVTLLQMTPGCEIAPEVARCLPIIELGRCACDVADLINDLVSYQKDVEFEGAPFNALSVVRRLLGCDLARAAEAATHLLAARARRFEQIADTELGAVGDELGLDAAGRAALKRYVEGLRRWMHAQVNWHLHVRRYTEEEARKLSPIHRLFFGAGPRPSLVRPAAQQAPAAEAPPLPEAVPAPSGSAPSLDLKGLGTSAARLFAPPAGELETTIPAER